MTNDDKLTDCNITSISASFSYKGDISTFGLTGERDVSSRRNSINLISTSHMIIHIGCVSHSNTEVLHSHSRWKRILLKVKIACKGIPLTSFGDCVINDDIGYLMHASKIYIIPGVASCSSFWVSTMLTLITYLGWNNAVHSKVSRPL